jgi:diguanylate cyclase (GGDEF)-like protein
MQFDYGSLLLATGVAATAGGMTFILSWAADRSGSFLVSCGAALLTVSVAIGFFFYFDQTASPLGGYLAATLLLSALTMSLGSAKHFRFGRFPLRQTILTSGALILVFSVPYLFGFDGLSFTFLNLASSVLLFLTAREYLQCHAESPAVIKGLVGLHILCAISFVTCAIMLMIESPLVLNGPPENWAESLNLAICVITVTGAGALNTTLNHQRLVRQHRAASEIDPLTGLQNRRAMFDKFGGDQLNDQAAVLIFDLDNFKSINDKFGHATGDQFLVSFSEICNAKLRPGDVSVRLGGEEFAVILSETNTALAMAMAEAIRAGFEKCALVTRVGPISCTVSCGLHANADAGALTLEEALREADMALYRAKSEGRNRVCSAQDSDKENKNGATFHSRAIA